VLGLLQGLGFTGVTITDALEPLATTHDVPLATAAIRAARAGVDLLLFVGSERSTDDVYAALLAEARAGVSRARRCNGARPGSTSSPRRTRASLRAVPGLETP
jgi:beta-glucosidase-like glycosyl hydrolase